jgi:hypothetical protein
VSVKINIANAAAKPAASAYISGAGYVSVNDYLTILVDGTANAIAVINSTSLSISAANIAVNQANASIEASQNSYIAAGNNGTDLLEIHTGGKLEVTSSLISNAESKTGSNYGASVSFVSATHDQAYASSGASSSAYMDGAKIRSLDPVIVGATGSSTVYAWTSSTTVEANLACLGAVDVTATSSDTVKAYLTGKADVSGKSVTVTAASSTSVTVNNTPPAAAVSLANFKNVKASASIGNKITEAYIGGNATVHSTGLITDTDHGISVLAISNSTLLAQSLGNTNIGAIQLGAYEITTDVVYSSTKASLSGNAVSETDINVTSGDEITARASASVTNGGLAAAADSVSRNTVTNQTVQAQVGELASLNAKGDICVSANSAAALNSAVRDSSYGLGTGSSLQAYNTLNRNTLTEIGSGARIVSAGGDISILATADGMADHGNVIMDSSAVGYSGSAIAAGGGTLASAALTSQTGVNVLDGVYIRAIYGQLNVIADSKSSINITSVWDANALGGSNQSNASATASETVYVKINESGSNKSYLNAKDTRIAALISRQRLYMSSSSITWSAASNTRSNSTVSSFANNLDVVVGNA